MSRFLRTPSEFRNWLEKNHATALELWVGFYKKGSGRPSITSSESVDEALCFGWIHGIRKSVDESSYQIRFTPRRRGSIWSAINIKRAQALTKEKRMRPAGAKAFAARLEYKSGINPTNNGRPNCPRLTRKFLRRTRRRGFLSEADLSYRKTTTWWIVSAKLEEKRLKRLGKRIEILARRKRVC